MQVYLIGSYLTRVLHMARTDQQCQIHTVGRNHEYKYKKNWTTESSVTCPIIVEQHSDSHKVLFDKNDDAKGKKDEIFAMSRDWATQRKNLSPLSLNCHHLSHTSHKIKKNNIK